MTKYSNQEVAHKWYYGGPDERFEGSDFFTDGDCASLYSYGLHFIVAHKVNSRPDVILFNSSRYSISTAKHQAHARGAIDMHKSKLLYVPDLDMALCDAFDALGDPSKRAKLSHWHGTLRRYIDTDLVEPFERAADKAEASFNKRQTPKGKKLSMNVLIKDFGAMHATYAALEDTLEVIVRIAPLNDRQYNGLANNVAIDRYTAIMEKFRSVYGDYNDFVAAQRKKAEEERVAALERQRAKRSQAHAEGLAAWRAGMRPDIPYSDLFLSGVNLLRIRNGKVETSGGVKLPINDGMKILARMVLGFEAGKLPFGTLEKGVTGRASSVFQNYPLNEITREKWVIGCHTIPFTEIVYIANEIGRTEVHNG